MFEKKCPKYLKTFLQYVLSIKIVLFVFSNMLLSKYAFYVELQDCNLKKFLKFLEKILIENIKFWYISIEMHLFKTWLQFTIILSAVECKVLLVSIHCIAGSPTKNETLMLNN